MKPPYLKLLIVLSIALLVGLFFSLDLQQYLTLDHLKSRHSFYLEYYEQNQIKSLCIYFVIFFVLIILSIPGITVVSLAGGALFGFPITLLLTSFADALGSTVVFLASRYLFGNSLQARYSDRLRVINKGVNQEGPFYLFSLRLIPFFPCCLINLLMGVTTIQITTFYWVTQMGKLPYTILYINAGTQLARLESVLDIFSPGIIISFVLIGLFPLISKKSLQWVRIRKEKQGILKNKLKPGYRHN